MQQIIRKIHYFIKIFFFVLVLSIIFDLFINIIIPEKIKKKIGITRNYSLKSEVFHHEIAPNIDLYEHWGKKKYKVTTNKYSMRILNEKYSEININLDNIGFIGDSFVYGSGIDYQNHFINLLNNNFNNYNLLNLGYVSYSPSIYLKKIKNYLMDKNIKFKKIFLFVDTSDIQDEGVFYREDKNGNIVKKWLTDDEIKKKFIRHRIKNYLQQNSFIFKVSQFFQPSTPDKGIICLNKKENISNYVPYLDYDRFSYGIDKNIQNKRWVKEGASKVIKYLDQIKDLSEKNEFELVLVYYPSAVEVLKESNFVESMHYKLLDEWSFLNKVQFIDTSNEFKQSELGLNNYKENFIECDVHWNKNGHKIIAKYIEKFLNEKNY